MEGNRELISQIIRCFGPFPRDTNLLNTYCVLGAAGCWGYELDLVAFPYLKVSSQV